jgi:hypothetical protein
MSQLDGFSCLCGSEFKGKNNLKKMKKKKEISCFEELEALP